MELNFKQFGQGEPLIILHGLFGTLDNWQTIAKQLAEDYTVFIVDQRNHGKSPHHPDFNYRILAEDLLEFMEQNWMYKAHLLGHSMGGKTVMQFALEYPDMVDKLIVVDIGPKTYKGGHQAIFDALFSLDLEQLGNRNQADEALAKGIDSFAVRQFLLKNLKRRKEGGYEWKMNLEAIHNHYQEILDNVEGDTVDVPTLFINGGKSDYIIPGDEEAFKAYFPESEIKTVPDAGHWVHAEKPKELLDLVQDFLSQ